MFSDDGPSYPSNITSELEVSVSLEPLIVALQDFLTRKHFAWFYPNEWKLIARREPPDPLDLLFDVGNDLGGLKLKVSLGQGGPEEFEGIVDEIGELIMGIVPS
jgi:hypothetical protein